MKIQRPQNYNKQNFKGFSDLVMGNIFLNKALFDLTSSDIPCLILI